MSTQKQEHNKKDTNLSFHGELPDEVRKEMSPVMNRQYQFWDELNKRYVNNHARQIIPLLNDVFNKQYTMDTFVELLSTEYSVNMPGEDGKKLRSIFADLLLKVGEKDMYHIEWQMKEDAEMVLRMLEYDFHIALTHGTMRGARAQKRGNFEMIIPKSVILYLKHTRNTPDKASCRIHFPDGTSVKYTVPVVKVQGYSPEDIEKKHLSILIPLMPLRFQKILSWKAGKRKEKAKKELTDMLWECIMVLEREKENGLLTDAEKDDLLQSMSIVCQKLFERDPEMIEVIYGEPRFATNFRFNSEIIAEQKEEIESQKTELESQKIEIEQLKKEIQSQNDGREKGIQSLLKKLRAEGMERNRAKNIVADTFSLDEESSEEKMEHYWENQ